MLKGQVYHVEFDNRQMFGSAIFFSAGPARAHFTLSNTLHTYVPVHATGKHVLEMEHKTTDSNSQWGFEVRYLSKRTNFQPVMIIVGSLGVLSQDLTPLAPAKRHCSCHDRLPPS
jgi:hypothetical protein